MATMQGRRTKVMTIRLTPDERRAIRQVARVSNTTVSGLIRHAVLLPALRLQSTSPDEPRPAA